MARALSAGPGLIVSREAEKREIIDWYRDLLDRTTPPQGLRWEPIRIGPTWQWSSAEGWFLPEATLGWDFLAWTGLWLNGKRGPWAWTAEQARFLLWYYAVESSGEPTYHSAALQRLKGWGKDPLAAGIAVGACFADVQFDHWDGDRPIGRPDPNAWVQIVAVSQEQTKNTMKLLPGLIPAETRAFYGIQIGKLSMWGLGDTVQVEAVTASPLALEGGRPTQIVRNETQNWNSSNSGHDMAGVMEGNAAKRDKDSPARVLDIFNAYRPGEDSLAERVRDAWEGTQAGADDDRPKWMDFGYLYDSLEAPPEAPLTAEAAPSVVEAVRGDADWLDAQGRILKSILNPVNPPSESRRKWYNQITATEDAWTDPQKWDNPAMRRPDLAYERGDEIVMFLDCSLTDDATGLVACRISDGLVRVLGMWQRPPGERGKTWTVPASKVDAAVVAAFDAYRVIGFFGDPSHVLDDETRTHFWDPWFDRWHRDHGSKLRIWARGKKGTAGSHAIMFDMADLANQRAFVEALGQAEADIEAATLLHDGDARLRQHVLAARRVPTRAGVSIGKEHRESRKKIDLAVCMVGARMVRRRYLNIPRKRGGRVL